MATNENLAANAGEKNDEDGIISMVDYLKEEEELEKDANAVLGDSDANQCTYNLGYRSRQALYACRTCVTADKSPAGVCLACSYACHEGHDLYELYTKRNFRCDCGNAKFPDTTCKLTSDKADYNSENIYNQNFQGLYCICSRPYPDPEDDIEDEMIQCIVCEDWYHGRHLGCDPTSDYQEMICGGCMTKHEFLWPYTLHSIETQKLSSESGTSEVDVEKSDTPSKCSSGSDTTTTSGSEVSTTSSESTSQTEEKTDKNKCDSNGNMKEGVCLLEELKKREITVKDCATFWSDGFRSKLCLCEKCLNLFTCHGVSYLTDETDTVMAYEKRGEANKTPSTQQDRETRLLEGMGRVQQIEMVQGFNDMKTALSDYLKHFADNGKVVRAEDIQEFFSQMQARKRQKTDHTPGHFCR